MIGRLKDTNALKKIKLASFHFRELSNGLVLESQSLFERNHCRQNKVDRWLVGKVLGIVQIQTEASHGFPVFVISLVPSLHIG